MYFVNNLEELTKAKIQKIIQLWRGKELHTLERYKNYYDGKQAIQDKYVEDETKPCNKITVNQCYRVVQSYSGYLSGVPISYNSDEDISDILEILKYNDYHKEDNQLLRDALIYGVAYELHYLDEEAQQRFTILNPTEVIPVYKNDLERALIAVIRIYSANDVDNVSKHFLDIYTDTEIQHYETDMSYASLKLLSVDRHYFGMVPVVDFELNQDRASIFAQIMDLQDAYNKLLSANVDDYEAFVDSYMYLKGLTADTEELKKMKVNRILLLDEDSDAGYITKPDNSAGVKNLLDKIEDRIERIAQAPDFNDESFGNASGISIKYKLLGMENICSNIEANMRQALQKRLELICAIQKLTATEFIWRDINIIFTRNIPVNEAEQAELVNKLRGLVSDKTLLSILKFIPDVDKELELLEEQNSQPLYDFDGEMNE